MSEPPSDPSRDAAPLRWGQALQRGLRKRCARCGGKNLFHSWLRQRERCPTCGMRFEREAGFFVGAYTINLALVFGALFVLCMVLVGALASGAQPAIGWFLVVGGVIAVATPVVGYPYARTFWSAIDLAMTPLEPVEEAEAALAVAAMDSGAPPTRETGDALGGTADGGDHGGTDDVRGSGPDGDDGDDGPPP